MVKVTILKHGLGGERVHDSTVFVDCEDVEAVKALMRAEGANPDLGWRNGYRYTAELEQVSALSLDEFRNIFRDRSSKKRKR